MNKPTPVKTDARQSGEEYRHNQDVTAPPDPVEPNSTSDVPIHGEKTNILFHPTPSVSYEEVYVAMEKRTTILVGAVFFAIVVLGKFFGGALYGLIPLGMCVSSGIFLWMKELIRQGRATEWSAEQKRGEYVRVPNQTMNQQLTDKGNCKSHPRVRRVDEHIVRRCVGTH